MGKYSELIAVGGPAFGAFFTQTIAQPTGNFSLVTLTTGDPILALLHSWGINLTVQSDRIRGTSSSSSWRTAVKDVNRPSFWDSIDILLDIKSGSSRVLNSNWKPRIEVSVSGIDVDTISQRVSDLLYGFQTYQGVAIGDKPVVLGNNGTSKFLTFDAIADFFKETVDSYDSAPSFYRLDPQGRKNWCWWSGCAYDEHEFSYSALAKSHHLITSNKNGWYAGYNVRVQRVGDYGMHVKVFMPTAYRVLNDVIQSPFATGFYSEATTTTIDKAFVLGDERRAELIEPLLHQTILGASPALYMTQSGVLYKFLDEYSRNLETFVESPGLLLAFGLIFDGVSLPPSRWFHKHEIGLAFRILKLISSGVLLYNLALKPSYDTVIDLLVKCTEFSVPKFEASMEFNSTDYLPAELPETLLSYSGISPDITSSFKFLFRSELTPRVGVGDVVTSLEALNLAASIGGAFSPSLLYELQPWTFVFETYQPVAAHIKAAERHVSGLSSRGRYTLGHSVLITYKVRGLTYKVFIRSDSSKTVIRPVGVSWKAPSTLPEHITFPLVMGLVL